MKLNFDSNKATFNGKKKILTAMIEGNFTRDEILDKLNSLAQQLNEKGRNSYLGVSAHYDYPNAWCPAILKPCNKAQVLYNPKDSPTTYDYETIDALYFYIIEMADGSDLEQKMHKKKKTLSLAQDVFKKKSN